MIGYKWIVFIILSILVATIIARYAAKKRLESKRRKFGFDDKVDAVRPNEILLAIEAEEIWARAEHARLSDKLFELRNPSYELMTPEEVVQLSEKDEKRALHEITGEESTDSAALVNALRDKGSNTLAQIWRMFSPRSKDISVPYEEILRDACKHMGIRDTGSRDIYSLEVQLQKQTFSKVLESMPEHDRQRFLTEFSIRSSDPTLGKEAVVGSGIVVANLSGFGLYLASSTALGAITSAIGVTLPFAVYTGMSSTMALLIGPVGWVALGAWVIHKLGKPDSNKVVAGTLMIANIRQRLIAVRDEPLPRIKNDRDVVLGHFRQDLSNLRDRLQVAQTLCLSDSDRVAISAYRLPARPSLYATGALAGGPQGPKGP